MGLPALYPWLKALHIISVIAWMAALLYLPRLFVYHADAPIGSARSETFKIMERRLLRAIATPAMIATILFGLFLLAVPGLVDWHRGYMHAKLLLVLGLAAMHGLFARWVKAFAADRNRHPSRFYRMVNEVPTILMIAIVLLIVVRPF